MCKWCSRYGDKGITGLRAWLASLAMLAACGYPPLPAVCAGEDCQPAQECAARQDVCIDIGGCGNGVVASGEVCDDGNIIDGDGCSADCKSNETCGNGILDNNVQGSEQCDHGQLNGMPGDTCDIQCYLLSQVCGNGITEPGEECDESGDTAACNGYFAGPVSCQFSSCGDGYVNFLAEEACDVGSDDTTACNGSSINPTSARCQLVRCGDGHVNVTAGEDCESSLQCGASNTCSNCKCS
jgi:cysteine-rich repeat protein